ncbi:hypothetical protein ACHAQA_009086 [Verticillium albo-atrum]
MDAPFRTPPTRDRVSVVEHINFLSDAAHLLRATAPETSAWLMSRSNELSLDEGLQQTDAHRQRACGACGHIMIPGMGSSVKIEAERIPRKRQRQRQVKAQNAKLKTEATGPRKILQCGHCKQTTTIKLDAPPSIHKIRKQLKQKTRKVPEPQASEVKMKGAPSAASSKPSTRASTPTTSTANASSKKRAKSRKAGLQALLDQSKSSQGRSLSLADFSMKR